MELTERRRWLESYLGVEELPEPVWNKLVERRQARHGMDEDDPEDALDLEQLQGTARDFLDMYQEGSGRRARQSGEKRSGPSTGEDPSGDGGVYIDADLDRHERDRTRAAAKVAARRLGQEGEIVAFREVFLSGELLGPEQAREFLERPSPGLHALRSIAPWWSRAYGWEEDETEWTVLTGEPPSPSPLKIRVVYPPGRPWSRSPRSTGCRLAPSKRTT